ncbi:MAG: hypothetical protein PVF26_01520 [Desulfobacterales bacterium]
MLTIAGIHAVCDGFGVFKPGALPPVTPSPIKELPYLCFFPPLAEKSKPPASRAIGGSGKEEFF